MRWYIEISHEGQPTQKLCLDAAHWQPALQKAREIQGESGKLKGLAVEILEEGCRAIDSDRAMTYLVTPASEDASLVETLAEPKASSPRASLRGRRSRREKLSQRRKQRRESKPPEPEETPIAGKGVAKKTMMLGSQAPSRQPESASAPAINTIGYASQGEAIIADEPKPPKSQPPKSEPPKSQPPSSAKPGRVVPPDPEAPPVEVPAAKKTDVGQQLIRERNENASKDNPLRYHERVYAVKLPQTLASLDAFLRETLDELRNGLDDAGHVIRVALYDHAFAGKPTSPPIATVAWYGWRSDSELVFFPYADKPASSHAVAEKLIGSDMLGPGNVPSPAPKRDLEAEKRAAEARLAADKKKAEKAAEAARQAEEARKADAARKADEAQREEARRAEEKKAEEAKQAADKQRAADEKKAAEKKAAEKKAAEKKAEERRESDKKDVERIAEAKRASDDRADDKGELRKTATLGSGAKRSRRSLGDRKSVEPKAPSKSDDKSVDKSVDKSDKKSDNGARVSSAPGERRVKLGRGSQELRPSAPGDEPPLTREQKESRLAAARLEVESLPPPMSVPGNRVAGEQLLTDLFEEIAQLHYLEDALEGADFVLQLALQKLPSEVGLVSLFDIDKREYVVVRQAGGEHSALLLRVNERAEVPRRAMRKSRAVVLTDVRKAPEKVDERWDKIGTAPRSMICAPVEKAGRYLGLIELLNPHDGKAFSESDGHALTYIGQQYGEFLSNRGVTLDPDAVVATARR